MSSFNSPYPIAVFGTLRTIPKPFSNSHLMYRKEPIAHHKGFLPHFSASGLSLHFKPKASGIVEVFFYKPEDFQELIRPVDRLESFSPFDIMPRHDWAYERILVEIKILPDDLSEINERFDNGIRYDDRDLELPTKEWMKFPSCPAWVYCNPKAIRECNMWFQLNTEFHNPVLWTSQLWSR